MASNNFEVIWLDILTSSSSNTEILFMTWLTSACQSNYETWITKNVHFSILGYQKSYPITIVNKIHADESVVRI